MTKAYAKESDQLPNDLALLGIDTLISSLKHDYPDLRWTPHVKFGGLLDIPDQKGETRAQTPVSGLAVDLLAGDSPERNTLNIRQSIIRGHVPKNRGKYSSARSLGRGSASSRAILLL